MIRFTALIILLFSATSCLHPAGKTNIKVRLKTSAGDVVIRLYDDTPLHRDNFLSLVESKFYEGVLFHRVISEFMIQAGDPATRSDLTAEEVKRSWSYTIPAEILPNHIHSKGALAAARTGDQGNPMRESSGTQFYIVVGSAIATDDLARLEKTINNNIKQGIYLGCMKEETDKARAAGETLNNSVIQERALIRTYEAFETLTPFVYTEEQKQAYVTNGGTPHLDGTYTVFGEVVEGMDIVEMISVTETDESNRPVTPVTILKVKITR